MLHSKSPPTYEFEKQGVKKSKSGVETLFVTLSLTRALSKKRNEDLTHLLPTDTDKKIKAAIFRMHTLVS